jgi:iron complex transport system ATP-binding protein
VTVATDLVGPVAALRAGGFALPVAEQPVADDGWRPAALAATDAALRADLLARTTRGTGTRSLAVAATWQLEKHAWFVAAAALGGLLVHGRMPPLDRLSVRDGEHGWVEELALPATGWERGDGAFLAGRLEAHLLPLVDALGAHRPRRALWRCAGDRLGQAALWCGEAVGDPAAACALAAGALGAPTALAAEPRFTLHDGRAARRRTGCCLSFRCPDAATCADCPVRRP